MDLSLSSSAFAATLASSVATATMASFAAIMADSSIYTNYVNVHLSIDKLDGTNYDTWASDIKLWLKGQGYVDHLTCPNVAENEVSCWLKIDAQLCIVIKFIIFLIFNFFFVPMRHVHKFGNKKSYYTPMILNVFMVCVKISSQLFLPKSG